MTESTLTGKTVGKYHIEERLGKGGMAEVYKGYQETLERYVAIKVMHPFLSDEEDFLQRFKREARSMASLSHPNIVRVFDFDVYDANNYYLVMEYIDGGTLRDRLQRSQGDDEQSSLASSVHLITDVADALAYAHKRGMVHRDIKPANIMLRQESGQAVLTDFGIVKLVGNQSLAYTATGALIGTPSYMSPEQALGESGDERVDIYSLGILLFQMVTRQLPYTADTPIAVVMKHVNEPVPLPMTFNADLPLDLQNVIVKAMAKDPDERYQSAAEMAAAMRAIDFAGPTAVAAAATDSPPPVTDVPLPTVAIAAAGSTMAAATSIGEPSPETAVVPGPAATVVQSPAAETVVVPSRKRSLPLWAWIAGLIGLLLLAGAVFFGGRLIGGDESVASDLTSEGAVVAIIEETKTPPPPTAEPLVVPTEEAPDEAATELARLEMDVTETAEARLAAAVEPTDEPTAEPTNEPTATATVEATATPDATATLLAGCDFDIELVSATRENSTSSGVFPGVNFVIQWVLRNSGNCPWAGDFRWRYVEGETFGFAGEPVLLGTAVNPGDELILVANFRSPDEVGTYYSQWQLTDESGQPLTPPLEFPFHVASRETATPPASPTPPTPETSPTPNTAEAQVNYIFTVGSCEYPGGGPDWRCQMTITPYLDGSDVIGDYTVFIFDQPGGQAAVYRGAGPFFHFALARRCAAYNQEIRVVDDLTATEKSGQLYVDPDQHIDGGCTEN